MALKRKSIKEDIENLIKIIEENLIKQYNIEVFELLYFEYYNTLRENNIKRIDYYNIIDGIIKYFEANYSDIDIVFEILHEIVSDLIGHCHSKLIPRFYGEPEDQNELIQFVRFGKWKV